MPTNSRASLTYRYKLAGTSSVYKYRYWILLILEKNSKNAKDELRQIENNSVGRTRRELKENLDASPQPRKGPEDEPLLDRLRDAGEPLLNPLKGERARHKLGCNVQQGGRRTACCRLPPLPMVQTPGAVGAVTLGGAAVAPRRWCCGAAAPRLDHLHHCVVV